MNLTRKMWIDFHRCEHKRENLPIQHSANPLLSKPQALHQVCLPALPLTTLISTLILKTHSRVPFICLVQG